MALNAQPPEKDRAHAPTSLDACSPSVPPPGRVEPPEITGLTADHLRALGLFGALNDATLEAFAALPVIDIEPGAYVFQEGDIARAFYISLEGELEALKATPSGDPLRIFSIKAGQWFGDMSVLDVQPRFASVRALTACRLLSISARDLDALYRRDVKSYSLLVLNLARELSRRLRSVDQLVFEMLARLHDRNLGCG